MSERSKVKIAENENVKIVLAHTAHTAEYISSAEMLRFLADHTQNGRVASVTVCLSVCLYGMYCG